MALPSDLLSTEKYSSLLAEPIVLAVLVGLGFLVLFLLTRIASPGSKGNAILVLGPCNSGKTTLFLQLRDGTAHLGTVASMQENSDIFVLHSEKARERPPGAVQIVDVPGHPRVRRNFDGYVDRAKGIIFLVDATDFMPQKGEVAEQLFDVLSHRGVRRRRLPVLLACNKTDLGAKAHTVDFVRKRLEKELDQLRTSRVGLSGQEDTDVLGKPGEAFTFDGLAKGKGAKVSAAGVSALTGDIQEVEAFIRRCVPA